MTKDNFIEIDGIQRKYLIERKKTKIIKYKVFPDLSIKIIAPKSISLSWIHNSILQRKDWIKKNLDFYSKHQAYIKQELKSGSQIYYLGKQYKLKIIDSLFEEIKINGEFLVISTNNLCEESLEDKIDNWYNSQAVSYFNHILMNCVQQMSQYGIGQPSMYIRKMKSRWGSCIRHKNKITINLHLIEKSTECIEYVIKHELCHLKYSNHNSHFYSFLSSVMPDWRIRKNELDKLKI
ncbi:MAG: hypothetical protein HW421_3468 [Ignavibacteria bacterium]|nr:hypothetical protein [Ignavibacteria bacterium]